MPEPITVQLKGNRMLIAVKGQEPIRLSLAQAESLYRVLRLKIKQRKAA